MSNSLRNAIYQHLKADTTLNALGGRILPDFAHKGTTFPYLVWQRVTGSESTCFDGQKGGSYPIFQFTIWAKDRERAEVLRELLRTSLEGKDIGPSHATIEDYQDLMEDHPSLDHIFGALLEVRFHVSN